MKHFLAGISLIALASPAFAADAIYLDAPVADVREPFSGHIEGYIGGIRFDAGEFDDDAWIFGGAARANYAFTSHWNIQGDLFGESTRFDDFNFDHIGAGAHLFWRDPNSFALGVFGSVTSIGSFIDLKEYLIGPEGQVYFGNLTLYGQAYYGKLDSSDGFNADIWGARGVARYFLHDNFKLEGEVGFRNYSEGGDDLDVWTLAAQADYRFADSPFSVFGRYQFDTFSDGPGADLDTHKFLVGFRGTFGAKTLMEEDRYGATMDLPSVTNIFLVGGGGNGP
jgi:hypothetical protein